MRAALIILRVTFVYFTVAVPLLALLLIFAAGFGVIGFIAFAGISIGALSGYFDLLTQELMKGKQHVR